MDLFALILVSITAVTICGICLFIVVCAFQPRFLRKLHGKTSRTYQDTDSNASSNNKEDQLSVKSVDLVVELTEPTVDSSLKSPQTNARDKKAYLKSLEQSLRTGRRIQTEDDDNNNNNNQDNESDSKNPFNFIRHCINKHIRRKTSDTHETTDL